MLEFATSQQYEPGVNRPGDQAEDVWLFLLPSLRIDGICFLGSPSPGTRTAWEALGARAIPTTPSGLGSEVPGCTVIWIGASVLASLHNAGSAVAALDDALTRGASVYLEASKRTARAARELAGALGVTFSVELSRQRSPGVLESWPDGLAAWLVPRPASARISRLRRAAAHLAGSRVRQPRNGDAPVEIGRVATGPPDAGREVGFLLRTSSTPQLPEYVREAAASHGYELDGARWSVSLPRGYRSQKVVFHVPERRAIVKVTQDPRFNHRLQNEYDALRAFAELGPPNPAVAPEALFASTHGRLLVVGESRVDGVPFRERSDGSPTCAVARSVLDALTELALIGGRPERASSAGEALESLLRQHERIHSPGTAQLRFLEGQIDRIAAEHSLRGVFLHGDPTTFNVLVAADRIGLVDWENAEPAGLPLWDVLHFVTAYAGWAAERSRRRWTAARAQAMLLEQSPFHTMLVTAIGRYRAAVGVPAESVGPLVFTWWMLLALREATRLPPARVDRGFYGRLLARSVEAGETTGLRALAG